MRILTLAMTTLLAFGVAATASAATKKKHVSAKSIGTFEQCEQLAIERGVPHGQVGHTDFVAQCMGKPAPGRKAY
jgi:ABC-type Fe2+-enterobactin transport system substrate-binding protein